MRRGAKRCVCLSGLVLSSLAVSHSVSATQASAHVRSVTVGVFPEVQSASGRTIGHASGYLRFPLPAGWRVGPATQQGTTANLSLRLSPACTATLEVTSETGVPSWPRPPASRAGGVIASEIQFVMASWFYEMLPPEPPTIHFAAHRTTPRRSWAIGTPPPREEEPRASEGRYASPYVGVLRERLQAHHIWGAARFGVRTSPARNEHLPSRETLLAGLVEIVGTARLHVRIRLS
jgi:hypothetical protein